MVGRRARVWSTLSGDHQRVPLLVVLLVAAAACTGSPLLLVRQARVAPVFEVAAVLTATCVTVTISVSDAWAAAANVFYIPVALYVAYFLSRRATVAFLVGMTAAFAAVAVVQDLQAAWPRAAVLGMTIMVTGALVRVLRDRIFRLIQALDRSARTDALTGVLNRLGIDERLDEELERAQRTGLPCAVLMGDLDRFKELNDRFGHDAGDDALRRAAGTIPFAGCGSSMRSGDSGAMSSS